MNEAVTGSRTLARQLSLFDVSTMSSASMGPAYSLASTMGPMVAIAGLGAPISLVLVTLFMGCIAWTYSALSARYPAAGSVYSWVYQAFGRNAGAFIAWILIIANVFAVLATAIPAGTYTLDLLAPQYADSTMWVAIVSALWVAVSGALLATGIRPTAGVTAVLLIAEVVVLGVSAVVAAWSHPLAGAAPAAPVHFNPAAIAGAMVLGIWMVDGWELSAATSEEAHHRHASGRGGLLALAGMSLTLLLCMSAYLHFLGPAAFSSREADAMALVGTSLGGWWRPVIVLTVLVSTSASLWTTVLYLTRSLYAMGRDGMIARLFAVLHPDGTPRRALTLVTVLGACVTALSGVSASVAAALTLALSGSGVFLGMLFVGTAAAAMKLVSNTAMRAAAVLGILGISGAILVEVSKTENGALRMSGFIGLLLGIPFAFWRGRRNPREVL